MDSIGICLGWIEVVNDACVIGNGKSNFFFFFFLLNLHVDECNKFWIDYYSWFETCGLFSYILEKNLIDLAMRVNLSIPLKKKNDFIYGI